MIYYLKAATYEELLAKIPNGIIDISVMVIPWQRVTEEGEIPPDEGYWFTNIWSLEPDPWLESVSEPAPENPERVIS